MRSTDVHRRTDSCQETNIGLRACTHRRCAHDGHTCVDKVRREAGRPCLSHESFFLPLFTSCASPKTLLHTESHPFMPIVQSTANQKMIVTHCTPLHHPHHPTHDTYKKTHTHHLKHIHLICVLERNSQTLFTSLKKKTKLIENRRFLPKEVQLCIEADKNNRSNQCLRHTTLPKCQPDGTRSAYIRNPESKARLHALFCEPHISHRQTHHTTTPANELLTTGYEGGPERTPHLSAPPLPLSNLKKPDSPQDEPQEFLTFQ